MADAKLAHRVSLSSPTGSICSCGGGTTGSGGDGSGDGDTDGGGDGEDDDGKSESGGKDDDVIMDQNKMDNLDLTMEEYIEPEAEKARKRGQTFNWKTTTYSKGSYFDDFNYLKDFKNEFLAVVYNDALTSKLEISSESTVRPLDDNKINFRISFDESDDEDYICLYDKNLFSYKLISMNDLKTDSEYCIDEVDLPHNNAIEQLDSGINYNVDTQSHEFDEDFETNHDAHGKSFNIEEYFIIIGVIIQ
ncbi:hypothetical protein Tco_0893246 [Tanacetum coccineum]|uniref:Uncharacterized protein n=1 Tax=Tanacetum coccineum TaxID=301880 RepID=A0ABQ5CDM6_9ASTR